MKIKTQRKIPTKQTSNLKQCLRRSFFVLTIVGVLVALQSVHADTITVTNANDSGTGSLRQALADAHDGDTINFDGSLNYMSLFSGELVVDKSATISSPAAANLVVDANQRSRVFHITNAVTVTICGLSIAYCRHNTSLKARPSRSPDASCRARPV